MVLFGGQWSALAPSLAKTSPFILLPSLIDGGCGSQLKPGTSSALGAWGELHVSSPVFGLREKWAIGGRSVMNVNHPFEIRFPVLPKHRLGGSRTTRRELCRHGAPQTVGWEKPFPWPPGSLCLLHMCCCSSWVYPAAVQFNSSASFGWQ